MDAAQLDGDARDPKMAAIRAGRVHTRDDFNERRLPGAVLADDGVDLAGAHLEGNLSQRMRPAEVLVDRVHLQGIPYRVTLHALISQ